MVFWGTNRKRVRNYNIRNYNISLLGKTLRKLSSWNSGKKRGGKERSEGGRVVLDLVGK